MSQTKRRGPPSTTTSVFNECLAQWRKTLYTNGSVDGDGDVSLDPEVGVYVYGCMC